MIFSILMLFITQIYAQCNSGCLVCLSSNICAFCDYKGYILSGIKCVAFTSQNCVYWDQSGACLACVSGYYVDVITVKCIQVSTSNSISNCNVYASSASCSSCSSGFLLVSNVCVQTNTTITGCSIYDQSNKGQCISCQPNYILHFNLSACIAVSPIPGCVGYNLASCLSCAANYTLNLNLYQTIAFNYLKPSTMTKYMVFDDQKYANQGNFPSCQFITAQIKRYQRRQIADSYWNHLNLIVI